ncbi:unnamed protein product [Urochloa decumbens]|uniref:Uncharacterized protein n=1 Tax=Urochloa decumbens TaxID=240449 RepID=A0ABC9B9F4_9POAL
MQEITVPDVKAAVQKIVPYLEDTSNDAPDAIYYNGWGGLGASAALRAIAEHPPPSLMQKFGKIIHIDCSRWKSRRALQRRITDELKLTQKVAPDFYRQDKEDDFSGVDQGSRAEIGSIATVIARFLAQNRCLVVFHNGSDGMVDLHSCGIPQPQLFGTKVLWTFGGWLRLNTEILKKVHNSHLSLEALGAYFFTNWNWNATLAEEAREIAFYIHNKLGLAVTPEIATECYLYLLSLNYRGGNVIDYNWTTHASSYWVSDGIVEGGQDNQAWELARALQQHIRLDDYSSNTVPYFAWGLDISTKHWIFVTNSYFEEVSPRTTSLFFAPGKWDPLLVSLPSDAFHKADQLRVLKLCLCTFNFSSPPFHCCPNLRFLGLDRCMDGQQLEEEEVDEKMGARAVKTFQRLWVLDVCNTDWELAFPLETEEQVSTNIREVHVINGRIWCNNLGWRRLPNLRKLRVINPTSSWDTGKEDEFMDMLELELLDLSGNSTMKVLPRLSGAIGLKTLVLDGCVGLEHIGPQGLPPSLESFCLDTGADKDHENSARISRIRLAGCARLSNFRLRGSLPELEELDLSHTAVKMLDLREVVKVGNLQRILLMGCQQLCSFSWPASKAFERLPSALLPIGETRRHQIRLLCIEGGEVGRKPSWYDSWVACQHEGDEHCRALVAAADMRFLQSLKFLLEISQHSSSSKKSTQLKMDLYLSSTSKDDLDGKSCYTKRRISSTGRLAAGSPLPKSLAYHGVSTQQQITTQIDAIASSSATMQFQPLDVHVEIGEGISDITNAISAAGRDAISFVMNRVQSLHVHDSSSITTVVPEHFVVYPEDFRQLNRKGIMNSLQWCRVERCPKLDTVFATNYDTDSFSGLETFWVAHLLMARSIWSRPRRPRTLDTRIRFTSFERLRAIHLHFCPRLKYVLVLSSNYGLPNKLEILHILYCGDLTQVFPVEEEFLKEIAASPTRPSRWEWKSRKGMLEFPKLKDLYLHGLPSLQLICEAKMYAPNLETIYLRDCWGLRRLPATDARRHPVAVDCEKECWDKLEWDGMEFGHHPSLFQPRHSKYYKKRHLRGTVLQ